MPGACAGTVLASSGDCIMPCSNVLTRIFTPASLATGLAIKKDIAISFLRQILYHILGYRVWGESGSLAEVRLLQLHAPCFHQQ